MIMRFKSDYHTKQYMREFIGFKLLREKVCLVRVVNDRVLAYSLHLTIGLRSMIRQLLCSYWKRSTRFDEVVRW